MKITLSLDKVDALAVLSAVEDGALSWRLQAAISTGIEREYAELRAKTLSRHARTIMDTLYPDAERIAFIAAIEARGDEPSEKGEHYVD